MNSYDFLGRIIWTWFFKTQFYSNIFYKTSIRPAGAFGFFDDLALHFFPVDENSIRKMAVARVWKYLWIMINFWEWIEREVYYAELLNKFSVVKREV